MTHPLPLIYRRERRLLYLLAGCVLFTVFYLGVSRVLVFEAVEVQQLPIDRLVPFTPWSIWVYLSTFPFLFGLFWVAERPDNLSRLLFGFTALLLTSSAIFWFFPTTIPRTPYAVEATGFSPNALALDFLRLIDKPTNCVPSLHVSASLLFTLFFFNEARYRRYFPMVVLWFLLIVWSTMATKQHYFIDVVAGAGMGLVFYLIFFRWLEVRAPEEATTSAG